MGLSLLSSEAEKHCFFSPTVGRDWILLSFHQDKLLSTYLNLHLETDAFICNLHLFDCKKFPSASRWGKRGQVQSKSNKYDHLQIHITPSQHWRHPYSIISTSVSPRLLSLVWMIKSQSSMRPAWILLVHITGTYYKSIFLHAGS